jgi:hypothetical protein
MHSCSTLQALQCLMMHATVRTKRSGCGQCHAVSAWQPRAIQCCLHRLHDLGRSCHMATALFRDGVSTNCITHRLVPWWGFHCITNGRSVCYCGGVSCPACPAPKTATVQVVPTANDVPCLSCNAVTPTSEPPRNQRRSKCRAPRYHPMPVRQQRQLPSHTMQRHAHSI